MKPERRFALRSARERWFALHVCLGVIVCVLIPGWGWIDGSRALAWTMYSSSATYRLRIKAVDGRDRFTWVAPSALAARAEHDVQSALAGTEIFRHSPQGRLLRRYLPRIAELACAVTGAAAVDLTLEQKATLDAPLAVTHAHRDCRGSEDADPE